MKEPRNGDLVIYHGSTGDPLNRTLFSLPGKKLLRYHNITPPQFFRGYSKEAEQRSLNGYREFRALRGTFDRVAAVSAYNGRDLRKMGYTCPIDVCPILIPFGDYEKEPDREVLERYRGDGWTNLLFVGRIAPNKRQEDVIRAFAWYHRNYNPKSRLFLVGNDGGMERYRAQLDRYIRALGLEEAVIFPGHISFAAILAYYRLADVFVCMSEHEGFCVPLAEAMYFGVPIVARRAAAVPDTLGGGGLLLDGKDPAVAAAAIDRILRDEPLRNRLAEEQRRTLGELAPEKVRERFLRILDAVTA